MRRAIFVAGVAVTSFFLPQGVSAESPDHNLMPADFSLGQVSAESSSEDLGSAKGGSFGLQDQFLNLNATDFTPLDSPTCGIKYVTNHAYMLAGSCTSPHSMAPVYFPAGAWVRDLTCYTYDVDAVENTGWQFQRVEYPVAGGPPSYTTIASRGIDHSAGWSGLWALVGETFRYQNGTNAQFYYLRITLDPGNSNLRFLGCRFLWKRQITPAPASASFSDVPVGSFGFQHIEALAASGVTGGCGGGNFCPNNTLTRVEMAIFLAKALGLHYPS